MLTFDRLKQVPAIIAAAVSLLLFSACGSHVYHQVRPDDTLYSISWRYNQDYREIARWNDIKPPYIIHEGEWLRVAPPRSGSAAPSHSSHARVAKTAPPSAPASSIVVTKPEPVVKSDMASRSELHWQWPVKGRVIGKFKANSPGNQGINIAAPLGTPVYAAAAGKVVYSGNGLRGYGNLIIIKHNDKYLSAYGHNRAILVKEGSEVKEGEMIGRVGDSEAEHAQLHFQIRIDGKPVDPLRYLP